MVVAVEKAVDSDISLEFTSLPEDGGGLYEAVTLCSGLRRLCSDIFSPDPSSCDSSSLFRRTVIAVNKNLPLIKAGSVNSSREVLRWTQRGSALRALLVISLGTIIFVALTGLLIFILFFVAVTANAVIISLLMSLAAAGGFLALFLGCLTAIYVAALCTAALIISTATISTIIAALLATGWVGFLWVSWMVTKRTMGCLKHSLNMTGTAFSSFSTTKHAGYHGPRKVD